MTKHWLDEIDDKSLYQRYRHLSYAFEAMIVTLAIGGMMEHNSNIELIKRTAAAVNDHGSLAAVAVGRCLGKFALPWMSVCSLRTEENRQTE